MRYGIYGAGSLGIIVGAYLARAGIPVELINRNHDQVKALRENGACVVGSALFSFPVKALLPEEMSGTYDVLFLTTKQLDNEAVIHYIAQFLENDGVIVTMQNGLPEPGIGRMLGEDRVLGCTVEWGATLVSPGVSCLTSSLEKMSFSLGSITGKRTQRFMEVQQLLTTMCPVRVEDNFMGVRWSKLLVNASFSGMSTVQGCTFGEAVDDKQSRRYVLSAIKECIDVARAEGILFAPFQGKDIVKLMDYHGPIKQWISSMILPIVVKEHRLIKASMLQDLEKGKLTEVDAINGSVVAYGEKHGVSTPVNAKIVEIIHAMEQGGLSPSGDNLRLFTRT